MSPEQAARIHLALLERTVAVAAGASLSPVELWVAHHPEHPAIREIAERYGLVVVAQEGTDLGERMDHAAAATLKAGHLPVIIGTDCPEMNDAYLRDALVALESGIDVVLGPAEDGGYVLIGLSAEAPQLFRGVAWSTAAVMHETRVRIRRSALSSLELPSMWDLDRPEDLERLDVAGLVTRFAPS